MSDIYQTFAIIGKSLSFPQKPTQVLMSQTIGITDLISAKQLAINWIRYTLILRTIA